MPSDAFSSHVVAVAFSWASGANLWGQEKDEKFSRPTHYDGMLEVVGVTGIVHLGQIQSGIRSAVRLAQGGHVRRRRRSRLDLHPSIL